MKVYDKDMYQKQESMKFTFLIIVVFLVGFFAGYLASTFTTKSTKNTKSNNIVEVQNFNSNK